MTPISSSTYGKLLLYVILLLPTMAFILNIIPVLFIAFGLYMTQRTFDFDHIFTAGRNVLIYLVFSLLILIGVLLYFVAELSGSSYLWLSRDEVAIPGTLIVVVVFYIFATKYLFIKPLANHRNWIEVHGLLPSRMRSTRESVKPSVRLFGSTRLKRYSVADELSKWSKLYEDGHINVE